MTIRAAFSRRILSRLQRHPSNMLRRLQIQLLHDLSARAFGQRRKRVWILPANQALQEYARFTAFCMDRSQPEPELLFQSARDLGKKVRRLTGLTDRKDLQRLVFLLYRNIDIHMEGSLPGEITVTACYFSHLYSPRQCRVMSNMDSGVISGIFGGGRLRFSGRITEGCPCCAACFKEEENHE